MPLPKRDYFSADVRVGLLTLTAPLRVAKRYSSRRQINLKKLKKTFACHDFWSI